jgi:AraC-like DNA-binding protein
MENFINVIITRDKSLSEIIPLFVGHEKCAPNHIFGPYTREHHLIHFCISGKGVLEDKYGKHEISAGEMFIIRPGEITVYSADKQDPWEYLWIAFEGSRAHLFSTDRSVYKTPDEIVEPLCRYIDMHTYTPDAYLAILHLLLDAHFAEEGERADIVSSIKRYIQHSYMEDISVAGISDMYSFERSYLFRIFKIRYGMGMKEYITHVRMERAKSFLRDGISVSSCAAMVGYSDVFNFSRMFKKHFGISPRDFKNE